MGQLFEKLAQNNVFTRPRPEAKSRTSLTLLTIMKLLIDLANGTKVDALGLSDSLSYGVIISLLSYEVQSGGTLIGLSI